MVTKKDFEAIAEALFAAKPIFSDSDGRCWIQWENDVILVAQALEKLNPNFDKLRFYKAAAGNDAFRLGWLKLDEETKMRYDEAIEVTCIGCNKLIARPSDAEWSLFRSGIHVHNNKECIEKAAIRLDKAYSKETR